MKDPVSVYPHDIILNIGNLIFFFLHIWDVIYSKTINPLIIREDVTAGPSFSPLPQ